MNERLDRNKVYQLRTATEISTGFAALGEPTSAKDFIYSNLSRVIVMFDPTRSNTI